MKFDEMTGPPLRVLIVDDHPMVRQVIRLACSRRPNLEIVGEVAFGMEAIERAVELEPDVMVLDLGLPDIDGLEVVRQLKAQLTSISTATKAVWTGLDTMRSNILTRVIEAEGELRTQAG